MDYKVGDVVLIKAVNAQKSENAGMLFVKVGETEDGLHFGPFLFENVTPIPISVIDYFEPVAFTAPGKDNLYHIEAMIREQGMLFYKIKWSIVSRTWNETKVAIKSAIDI
jgi:hypothetical protein